MAPAPTTLTTLAAADYHVWRLARWYPILMGRAAALGATAGHSLAAARTLVAAHALAAGYSRAFDRSLVVVDTLVAGRIWVVAHTWAAADSARRRVSLPKAPPLARPGRARTCRRHTA